MNRRTFVRHLPLAAGAGLLPGLAAAPVAPDGYTRYVAMAIDGPAVPFPEQKRVPLGLPAFPVLAAAETTRPVRLRFSEALPTAEPLRVRLTAAIDFREEKELRLYLPASGQTVGRLDVRFAHPFQPFQTAIAARWLPEVRRQGLGVAMDRGVETAWFFRPEIVDHDAAGLAPQLLAGERPGSEAAFFGALYSMNSFSPFGWMGGSVQDALWELHRQGDPRATATLETHLSHYLDDQHGVVFESPHTRPLDGTFNSIEDFLPFAAIANLYPEHPSVQKAVAFCLARRDAQGIIRSGNHVTTEGCYTVAYPLAAIARVRRDRALAQIALDQVNHRTRLLVDATGIHQRATLAGERAYRNWGRGAAWYLLGTVKTLRVLQGQGLVDASSIAGARAAYSAAAEMATAWMSPEHLWYGYLHRPETGVDLSASAGIAAALAWGASLGFSAEEHRRAAASTYRSLHQYLTSDGFTMQVAQINRGGEALQASGYRVIAQFGMGLMAQLKAALDG